MKNRLLKADELFTGPEHMYLASCDRINETLENRAGLQNYLPQGCPSFASVVGGFSGLNYLAASRRKS